MTQSYRGAKFTSEGSLSERKPFEGPVFQKTDAHERICAIAVTTRG
jgi:hypothetical protein